MRASKEAPREAPARYCGRGPRRAGLNAYIRPARAGVRGTAGCRRSLGCSGVRQDSGELRDQLHLSSLDGVWASTGSPGSDASSGKLPRRSPTCGPSVLERHAQRLTRPGCVRHLDRASGLLSSCRLFVNSNSISIADRLIAGPLLVLCRLQPRAASRAAPRARAITPQRFLQSFRRPSGWRGAGGGGAAGDARLNRASATTLATAGPRICIALLRVERRYHAIALALLAV